MNVHLKDNEFGYMLLQLYVNFNNCIKRFCKETIVKVVPLKVFNIIDTHTYIQDYCFNLFQCCIGIVLLTDGVGGFATPTSMHTIVSQLRTTNVSCWVVLCGGGTSEKISLGAVVDTQSLEHLTKSCNGCILNPAKVYLNCMYIRNLH